ncbi:MAG: metallophosphoesterase family protein [Deltaproteobacteria bacterium]|nr:metallophosphoesterase family protein [Deltaproteobacteria bacterium]
MRYAVLSDVHGNLEAFQAALKDVEDEGIESIVYLGDIVGYGANPKECLDLLRGKTQAIVAGNHDWGVTGKTDVRSFNAVARAAIEWTISQLDSNDKDFLDHLPLTDDTPSFTYTHSTPIDPQNWNYILGENEALENIKALPSKSLCFVGHSHIPIAFELHGSGCLSKRTSLVKTVVNRERRFIINVGSVGQPRDGDPRASYGIFDEDRSLFFLRRVEYDVVSAQRKILLAGLPPVLADRIGKGW